MFMIDVTCLQALQSVARHGTMARAGASLGFTASAVSQQIKRLERDLGVAVVAPAGRGVVLTPAGRAVVDATPEVLGALERCTHAGRSVAEGTPSGTLKVVAFSTAIRGVLAPVLPGLSARCPHLRVEVVEQDPEEALRAVETGTADLALVHDADGLPLGIPASLAQRPIRTDHGDVVVSGRHPLAKVGRPLVGTDLEDRAWVTSPPGTVCHQWFRRMLASSTQEPDVHHVADDFSTQMALVKDSDFLALMPRLARPPLIKGLTSLPLRRPPRREVSAVWRHSSDASPAIQAMLSVL